VRRAPRRWPVNAARRPQLCLTARTRNIHCCRPRRSPHPRSDPLTEIRVRVALASAPLSASP
jgi:hypothetical protein